MKKQQAAAPKTQQISHTAFLNQEETTIYWLGNAGVLINSHGTTWMIDPLLKGFDMPLLIDMPIDPKDVPALDAVLITHCDNDHFSKPTCLDLQGVCKSYHASHYVAQLMKEIGLSSTGHSIEERFVLHDVTITLTPADHAWQNEKEKYRKIREYQFEDYCGYWMETKDGTIWMPGDSRLLESQLRMPSPDIILFDFSDDGWHIGLEDAITLANTYPKAQLILIHWGSVDAPDMKAFNADPKDLAGRVLHPDRIHVLAPGQPFIVKSKQV